MNEKPPPREKPEDDGHELSPREKETAGELRRLDPHLAGLYERGLQHLREIEEPGAAHLVAFTGRELSRGVLRRVLEDEGLEASDEELEQAPKDRRNRIPIAKALRLPPEDPRVDVWFRLPGQFAAWEKYRYGGPPAHEVRRAFEVLSDLLFGLVAPYYSTEAELDDLLKVTDPTHEHARQLQSLQVRAAQRFYFFGRLENPKWVGPLARIGFFNNPPDRQVNPDGSWSARPWPEGEFLVRAAAEAPEAVAEILGSVPETNENPVVWDLVAKAARRLPPDLAAGLVPRLTEGLRAAPAWFFSESVADLTAALAEAGRGEALDLASYVLYVESPDAVDDRERVRYRFETDWVLPRLGRHDQQELLDRLIAALERADAERTLRFLLSKVDRVQRLSEALNVTLLWLLSAADSEDRPDRDDVVAMLVEAAVGVAQRLAANGPEQARRVMEFVDSHQGKFFTRIGYLVLSSAGHFLRDRVDAVLRSQEAMDPELPASELAALLRAQFRNASPEARKAFAEALEAGPDGDDVRALFRGGTTEGPSDGEIQEYVRHWQRRVLTFFRGDIPEELHDLAKKLGLLGVEPSYRDQQLAEVGSYSEAGVGTGELTPVSGEELSKWTTEEIVEFLRDWEPDSQTESRFGLQSSLAALAKENPERALAVLSREPSLSPRWVESLLSGLAEAAKAGAELDWPGALNSVRQLARVAALEEPESADARERRRVVGYAASLIREGCAKDAIPQELAPEVWTALREAGAVRAVWEMADPYRDGTLNGVLMAVLNDASGHVAQAVVSAALWQYRSQLPRDGEPSDKQRASARAPVRKALVPLLDRWLTDTGPNAPVARAVMGQYLPQLHLLVPEWVEARASDLFEGGLEDPVRHPTWTSYISWSRIYDSVFRVLRAQYLEAARNAAVWATAAGETHGARSATERFAEHLIVALVRGLASVGDEDELLETAYHNLSASDWRHAYWLIFRGWSDSDQPPKEYVDRLVKLWEWRISELEKDPDSEATVEEAKGMGWLVRTPYLGDEDVVRLGRATARLAKGQLELHGQWDRMLELARSRPDEVFEIVEAVLLAQLREEFPYVPAEEVRPLLAHVLREASPEVRANVRYLINKLGERGFRQLKELVGVSKEQPSERDRGPA